MTEGWLALAGAAAAVALAAKRSDRLIERFWTRAFTQGSFMPLLLGQLDGIERTISHTRQRVEELRSARREADARRIAEAGRSYARGMRKQRRALARLRRVLAP